MANAAGNLAAVWNWPIDALTFSRDWLETLASAGRVIEPARRQLRRRGQIRLRLTISS